MVEWRFFGSGVIRDALDTRLIGLNELDFIGLEEGAQERIIIQYGENFFGLGFGHVDEIEIFVSGSFELGQSVLGGAIDLSRTAEFEVDFGQV